MASALALRPKTCGKPPRVAYSSGDSNPPRDALRMTLLSTAQHLARSSRKDPRGHMVPILAGSLLAAGAVALVAYLLWPTWGTVNAKGPERLPVSVGGTLFNVPAAAIRRKIQRHSGPQERVDLGFMFPSLTPPEAPKHVSADTVEEQPQPIDRIFLSITAHRDSLAPDMRVRTIYPRYLEQAATPGRGRIDVARVQGRLALRQRRHVLGNAIRHWSHDARAMRQRPACASPNAASKAPI